MIVKMVIWGICIVVMHLRQLGNSKVAEFRKALPEFRKVSNLRCVLAPFWAVFYIFEEKSKNIHFDFQFFFRVDNHTQY